MKNTLIEELKKKDFDFDNYTGILYILDNDEKNMLQMLNYLQSSKEQTRNEIFEFAFKITNTEFDIFEIEK